MGGTKLIAALLLLVPAVAIRGQEDGPAHLVKNINRSIDHRGSSAPDRFTPAGPYIYFTADDGAHGRELWRTDRTAAGTVAWRELGFAPELAHPYQFVPFGNDLLLVGDGLWRTDGTAAGTHQIEAAGLDSLAVAGESLFFLRDNGLWIADGSPGSARRLTTFDGNASIRDLVAADGVVFFTGCDAAHGCELWRSDGTADGTQLIADLAPGPDSGLVDSEQPAERAVLDGVLYFLARTPQTGVELWRSDGTPAGTRLVKDINPGPADGFVTRDDVLYPYRAELTNRGDTLSFVASDGVHGFELWRTDGSRDGTLMVGDLLPGPAGLFDPIADHQDCDPRVASTAVVDDVLFFAACTPIEDSATWQLWRSDGSAAGTTRVEDDISGSIAGSNHQLYFVRPTGGGSELRRRGPADASSELVTTLDGQVFDLQSFEDGLLLIIRSDATGAEPWWSDGTAAGTRLLRDIRGDDAGSDPASVIPFGDGVLFGADDGIHGRELWRSDASDAGTVLVADINPGPHGSDPNQPHQLGGAIFFVADDGVHGRELWRTDGTAAGTMLVADVQAGAGGSLPDRLTVVDDNLFFYADDGVHGRELWRSDGTAAGTVLVRDVRPGADGSDPYESPYSPGPHQDGATALHGSLYFAADDGVHGVGLWRSDGSADDTALVADLHLAEGRELFSLFAAGDRLFFDVTGTCPCEWESDGTAAGTRLLATPLLLSPPPVSSGGAIYAHGDDLVDSGLLRLDDAIGWVAVSGGKDVFAPFDAGGALFGLTGKGPVWRLGFGLEWPDPHLDLGGWAGFSDYVATDRGILLYDEGENALWTTDGTAPGTYPLQYLIEPAWGRQDDTWTEVSWLTRAGDHVFFAANSGDIGAELWALPIDVLPEICTVDCPGGPTPTETPVPTPTIVPSTPLPATPTPDCGAACTEIVIGQATGAPGADVTIPVNLRARREPVAGVELNIEFPPAAPIAAAASGRPDCRVNPDIGKDASAFVFTPSGCRANRTCSGMHAIVLSLSDVDPIADGALLLTCRVSIAPRAVPGVYPLTVSLAGASTPDGAPLPAAGVAGRVTVLRQGSEAKSAGGGGGCQIAAAPDHGALWGLLLAVPLLRRRRRRCLGMCTRRGDPVSSLAPCRSGLPLPSHSSSSSRAVLSHAK